MTNQPADEQGMNPYEIPHLPDDQRRVLQIIMRKREISYNELLNTIEALPANEQLTQDEVDNAIDILSDAGHILCVFDDRDETTYKANLRRKSGRNITIKGIWDVLDSASDRVDHAAGQKRRSGLANALYGDLDTTSTSYSEETPKQLETREEKKTSSSDEKPNKSTLAASLFGKLDSLLPKDDESEKK